MQAKTTRAFRTISEAGEELGLQPHVLRFWESKFSDLKPMKRGGDRRYYRPEDIEFLRGLKILLHDEKHRIKDVQKLIKKSGPGRVSELGRSVQKASRDKDIVDVALVPPRIAKPDLRVVTAEPDAPKPVEATAEPVPVDAPGPAPVPEPAPEPVAEPVAASAKPTDADDRLRKALSRLESLKGRWDDFDGKTAE